MVDIYNTLLEYTSDITVFDKYACPKQLQNEYNIALKNDWDEVKQNHYDAVILAVAHKEFVGMDVRSLLNHDGVVYDVKGVLPKDIIDARL